MKLGFIVLTFIQVLSNQTFASGCGGGGWKEKGHRQIGHQLVENIRGFRGMYAYVTRKSAEVFLTMQKFSGTHDNAKELIFKSDFFDAEKTQVHEVFKLLEALPEKYDVEVMERVRLNSYYDDCSDISENTEEITTFYQLDLNVANGIRIPFILWGDVRYNPPLQRR